MRERLVAKLNTLAVNLYKVLGFGALALILIGLVSYLGMQAFFLVNRGWIAPTIVSSTDRQMLELNTQIALQTDGRDRLLAERRNLEIQLADAERIIEAHAEFEARFAIALVKERDASRSQAGALGLLRRQLGREKEEILRSRRAFAELVRSRSDVLKEVQLIDSESWLTANHLLAQMADANLAFNQRVVSLREETTRAQHRLEGYDDLLGRVTHARERGGAPTAEALLLEREYTRSSLEAARARETRDALKLTIASLDAAVERHEKLLESFQRSPWIRATQRNVTVAFVPYENLESMQEGQSLYGCGLQLVWCHRVGEVREVYEGEVTVRHPVRNHELRGVMVEIEVEDGRWAREPVLHSGDAPFFL